MKNENGSASLILVFFVVLSLLISALVLDFGLAFIAHKQLQTVAEAASLAGALSAELIVEAHIDEDTGEVEYEYFASIVPTKAMQAAAGIINQYATHGGLMKTIQIHEINYECIEENGYNTRYAVTLIGVQKTLLSSIWSSTERNFNVKKLSEAKLTFNSELNP